MSFRGTVGDEFRLLRSFAGFPNSGTGTEIFAVTFQYSLVMAFRVSSRDLETTLTSLYQGGEKYRVHVWIVVDNPDEMKDCHIFSHLLAYLLWTGAIHRPMIREFVFTKAAVFCVQRHYRF
jgi:hypothetical protein